MIETALLFQKAEFANTKKRVVHREKEKFLRLFKDFSLGGILQCSECGSKMTPCFTNKKKGDKRKPYYYYRCTKTFKYDW